MFDRLKTWLTEGGEDLNGGGDVLQLAMVALLLEAARIVDGKFDQRKLRVIEGLLERRFGLSAADAGSLVAAAERKVEGSAQLFGFTQTVNERLRRERRIELIEMLWEVIYADHVLDPLEDSLLRRIAGLVDVSDRERGEAKRRVLQRLGIA